MVAARELEGRAALVSGGTRGIGLAIARAFLVRGARVAITGRRPETLAAALAALENDGLTEVRGYIAHGADAGAVARAFEQAEEAFGVIQVVVNNAAANPSIDPLAEVELAIFDKVMETNLRGYLIVAREAIGRLRKASSGGSIINVSSVAAERAWPGLGAYGVSKAAVNALTRVLASEVGKDGIRVNGIAPGVVRTRFSEGLWREPGAESKLAAAVPLGRIAEPDDIVGAAVFLATDASRYVTGETITVDGGMTTR